MKSTFLIFILFLTIESTLAQKIFGEGIVNILFDDKTVIEFYESKIDTKPTKTIEFFNDTTINSFNIKNIEEQKKWTDAWVNVDYSIFEFQYSSENEKWIEVVVNHTTGKKYWIKKTTNTELKTWVEYLSGMFSVRIRKDYPQKIFTEPRIESKEIQFNNGLQGCYQIKSMKGDWIEIYTNENCETRDINTIKSAWIKWKKDDRIIISYFPYA